MNRISFIIPYHNEPASQLKACLESILALSLSEEERQIIVVDDGSDGTPLTGLSELKNKFLYVRQANEGVAQARNRGLTLANGQYIQFVDSDDRLITDAYEHVIDILRYNNADIVAFGFNGNGISNASTFTESEPTSGWNYMLKNNVCGTVWSYLFSRDLLGTLRFTPDVAYSEDEEFTAKLILKAEKLIRTNAQAYFYNQEGASAIRTKDRQMLERRLNDSHNVILRLQAMLDTLPLTENSALGRRIAQLTMNYIYNVIVITHDKERLENEIQKLQEEGLFPLPRHNYTRKYMLFRKVAATRQGRALLIKLLR